MTIGYSLVLFSSHCNMRARTRRLRAFEPVCVQWMSSLSRRQREPRVFDLRGEPYRIAAAVVESVRALYAMEHAAKALKPAERLTLRQERSAPIVATLQDRLQRWDLELIPKRPMADAVNYALNQWQAMTIFLEGAAVPLDNNASEREMKRVVLNRKNSLFVGNERGGRTAGILSSFTSTCRRLSIDPQLYLTQLIANMPVIKPEEIDLWLPDIWKQRLEHAPL